MNAVTTPPALTMTSREVAELTGKRHDHVLRDIESMLDQLGLTSPQFWGELPDGYQRQQRVAFLPKDLTFTLVAGYNVQMRHAIVCRWQQLEALQAPQLPKTMAQALRLAAEQAEQLEQQAEQLALAAPKVEYVDRYVAANGALGFRQVAKLLNAKEPEFRAFLEDSKIFYRLAGVLTPYQNHIDAGRFAIKTGVSQVSEHAFAHARFTPKGVEWIAGLWSQHQVRLKQSSEVTA